MNDSWYLYIVKASDDSLYTGITNNLDRRITEHNLSKVGSKYLRSKRPVVLVYTEKYTSQSLALKRESAIKNWTRKNKLLLIERNTL